MDKLLQLWHTTGIYHMAPGQAVMILVCFGLIYLAIRKGFEPLLLIPIGFGGILANLPVANMAQGSGILHLIYEVGLPTSVFPLLIFMGVGAMTDFGPMLANPRTLLLGAAAQFGIFGTLLGALALTAAGIPGFEFTMKEAASIAIIGGADGPTSIFVTSKLAPDLLGPIAVAAYSYMALVPLLQPPIMRALTNQKERGIVMTQLRVVSKSEKIIFPLLLLMLVALLLPDAAPLVGMLCFGNLMRECGVVERLADTTRNALINLQLKTLRILVLGMLAFCAGTAAGVLMAKLLNLVSKNPINPLIGSAGVSAVPMAARVSNRVGLETNPHNFLLMHAMGPNLAGVIGSAVAAGILLNFVG